MLNEQQHLQKVKSNSKFLDLIQDGDFYDWIIVVCFYIQLHYVDAYILKMGHNPPLSHEDRFHLINSIINSRKSGCDQLKDVMKYYHETYTWSKRARYTSSSNLRSDDALKRGKIKDFINDSTITVPGKLSYPTCPEL